MKKPTRTHIHIYMHINFVSVDDTIRRNRDIFDKQRVDRDAGSYSNDLINLICHFRLPLKRE